MQKGRNSRNSSSSSGIFTTCILTYAFLHLGGLCSVIARQPTIDSLFIATINLYYQWGKLRANVKKWTGVMINIWHKYYDLQIFSYNKATPCPWDNVPQSFCLTKLLFYKYLNCLTVKRSRHIEIQFLLLRGINKLFYTELARNVTRASELAPINCLNALQRKDLGQPPTSL